MLDATSMAILTGAAGNIVAYMLNGQADAVRGWLKQIFRGETDESQAELVRQLGQDAAVATSTEAGPDQLAARWVAILATQLAQHPDLRPEVEAVAAAKPHSGGTSFGSVTTIGSGVSVGGHNFGSINRPETP